MKGTVCYTIVCIERIEGERAMKVKQQCSLVYKDGLTFLLLTYAHYTEPSIIPIDPAQGDSNPIDTTNRMKAALEMDGWILEGAGQGETNPNCHYWHFTRTVIY
jgi:hypothetical protein